MLFDSQTLYDEELDKIKGVFHTCLESVGDLREDDSIRYKEYKSISKTYVKNYKREINTIFAMRGLERKNNFINKMKELKLAFKSQNKFLNDVRKDMLEEFKEPKEKPEQEQCTDLVLVTEDKAVEHGLQED